MAGIYYDADGNPLSYQDVLDRERKQTQATADDSADDAPSGDSAAQAAGIAPGRQPFDEKGAMFPDADVNKMVTSAAAGSKAPTRELNPLHFGDFFRDNVFGGLDAKYVTGKRPATLFDIGTDALAASQGTDLVKRNAALIKENKTDNLAALKAAHLGAQIEQERATRDKAVSGTHKTNLDVSKGFDEGVSDILENYDSKYWMQALKTRAKQAGVDLPPETQGMVNDLMTAMSKEGATSIQDILSNKDSGKYSPELFNRARHTTALINRHYEESQDRVAQENQRTQAAALSGAKAADVPRAAAARDARVAQGAIRTGSMPNVQASQRAGIAPRQIPGAPEPVTDDQLDAADAARVNQKPLGENDKKMRQTLLVTRDLYNRLHALTDELGSAGGPLKGRVNMVKYKAGIHSERKNLDTLLADMQLFQVQGTKPFIQGMGRPAYQFVKDVQQHFGKYSDDPKLLREKLDNVIGPQLDSTEKAFNDSLGKTVAQGKVSTSGTAGGGGKQAPVDMTNERDVVAAYKAGRISAEDAEAALAAMKQGQ